jgi:hypothetical protein
LNLFQINEILEIYIQENQPPNWLLYGLRELHWIFSEYPITAAYINTATEVTEMFIIERKDRIDVDDVKEVNFTNLPRDKIISLLEEAFIVERKGDTILPGQLVKKLQQIRWEGYEMGSIEIQNKLLELHGILTVALTKSMIRDGNYLPQRALAVFSMLSYHMLSCEEEIEPILSEYTWDLAFAKLGTRQQNRIKRMMAGFFDGKTKIIDDITENGKIVLKPSIIEYITQMRERFRERERERGRE